MAHNKRVFKFKPTLGFVQSPSFSVVSFQTLQLSPTKTCMLGYGVNVTMNGSMSFYVGPTIDLRLWVYPASCPVTDGIGSSSHSDGWVIIDYKADIKSASLESCNKDIFIN